MINTGTSCADTIKIGRRIRSVVLIWREAVLRLRGVLVLV